MKTLHELKFERLIHSIIDMMATSDEEKCHLIEEFNNHSDVYYDCFCDVIYYLSTAGGGVNTLSIDERGKSYLNIKTKEKGHIYFDVLTMEQPVPSFEDIILYIDIALKELEEKINRRILEREKGEVDKSTY